MPHSQFHWEMFLRGGVAALLLFHLLQLALPADRRAARLALGGFTLSLLAYLFCQEPHVMLGLPRGMALALMVLCVGATGWMWAAARALFNDRFRFSVPVVAVLAAMAALGMAAHMHHLLPGSALPARLSAWLQVMHAAAMLAFTLATLWEIVGSWRDDLVEPRRAARRWGAMLVGVYAAVAVVVELALQGRPAGRVLPLLHVAGIGIVAMTLAVLVARRSLDVVLGAPSLPRSPQPQPDNEAPAKVPPVVPSDEARDLAADSKPPASPAMARLLAAMTERRIYRQEGLSLSGLATELGMAEAPLRTLINQQLGFRNFNDFLHHYRLEEATARLASEDLPILTIALECGYGSIGPFNRAFRQRMGMTPSEFRGATRLSRAPPTN